MRAWDIETHRWQCETSESEDCSHVFGYDTLCYHASGQITCQECCAAGDEECVVAQFCDICARGLTPDERLLYSVQWNGLFEDDPGVLRTCARCSEPLKDADEYVDALRQILEDNT